MKLIVAALFLSLQAPAGDPPAPAPVSAKPAELKRLALTWNSDETSMDSNAQHETWTLEGKKLSWSYEYSGYHPDPKFKRKQKKSATLNEKQRAALEAALAAPDLTSSREDALVDKDKDPDRHGGTTTTVVLQVERKGAPLLIVKVSGSAAADPTPMLRALFAVRDALNSALPPNP
jgi:hypothetical protein